MKLSEQINSLSTRIAKVENNVASAREENKEKLDARMEAAKADAASRREAFNSNVQSLNEKAKKPWVKMRDTFDGHREQARQDISDAKLSVDRTIANDRAAMAEINAETAVGFALMAIDEAEMAVIAAIEARAHADSL